MVRFPLIVESNMEQVGTVICNWNIRVNNSAAVRISEQIHAHNILCHRAHQSRAALSKRRFHGQPFPYPFGVLSI